MGKAELIPRDAVVDWRIEVRVFCCLLFKLVSVSPLVLLFSPPLSSCLDNRLLIPVLSRLYLDTCASRDSRSPHGRCKKMNSLSLLSSRVIGQSSSSQTRHQRSRSQGEISPGSPSRDRRRHRSYSEDNFHSSDAFGKDYEDAPRFTEDIDSIGHTLDEKSPLLRQLQKGSPLAVRSPLRPIPRQIFNALAQTIKFILSTLTAPGVYVAQCFRDDDGGYSSLAPVRKLRRVLSKASSADHLGTPSRSRNRMGKSRTAGKLKSYPSRDSILSTSASESEGDRRRVRSKARPSKTNSRSSEQASEENTPRRSIRIKLHNDEVLRRQKEQRRSQGAEFGQPLNRDVSRTRAAVNPDSLKSPTSPSVHKLTRYPHVPTPPRPLIPLRLPSYTGPARSSRIPQKTLVLDLDETLIHSLAKGGRMSSGHMVEVKLSTPMITALTPGGPATALGPQHPILYYVHKRPHCDDFLRKVCKWYKLVVFTASVQEYADPVIDWLEQERKFFQARYYRQHCTFRNGAYIKDLSSVEPDLSKVMILDNSPMSYIFHEGIDSHFSPLTFCSLKTNFVFLF